MKTISKALVGTLAAGAVAMTSAAPAMARHKDRNGVDAGDIIAGALILGTIAAVASSTNKNRGNVSYRDRNYRSNSNGYRQNNSRRAVERCVRAAENRAQRYGYRYADVTQIRDIDQTRYGVRVKGRLVVDGARNYRRNNNGNRNNNRGYNRVNYNNSGADRGKFTCYVENGRVSDINYSGIRGL